jgi:hypothetical protein
MSAFGGSRTSPEAAEIAVFFRFAAYPTEVLGSHPAKLATGGYGGGVSKKMSAEKFSRRWKDSATLIGRHRDHARAMTLATDVAYHLPPRWVENAAKVSSLYP